MWRALRGAVVLALLLAPGLARAEELGTLKVGVLKFGTVNWELDVIKAHGLDAKEGFTLEVQPFAGNDAADVALMGAAVDAIVEDWLFVSRQRASGAALTFIPYSSSVGAVMVPEGGGIASLADYAHGVGLKFGLWVEPERVASRSSTRSARRRPRRSPGG